MAYDKQCSIDWQHLELESFEFIGMNESNSIEEIENLNLFDLSDFESPSMKENLFNSMDEMSFKDIFTDLADLEDLNEIIRDNKAIEAEQQELAKCQSVNQKPVKRLDAAKQRSKDAVLRYKSKKLQKREELFRECQAYAEKNADLKQKVDDLQTEISLIKSLLVEALISKKL